MDSKVDCRIVQNFFEEHKGEECYCGKEKTRIVGYYNKMLIILKEDGWEDNKKVTYIMPEFIGMKYRFMNTREIKLINKPEGESNMEKFKVGDYVYYNRGNGEYGVTQIKKIENDKIYGFWNNSGIVYILPKTVEEFHKIPKRQKIMQWAFITKCHKLNLKEKRSGTNKKEKTVIKEKEYYPSQSFIKTYVKDNLKQHENLSYKEYKKKEKELYEQAKVVSIREQREQDILDRGIEKLNINRLVFAKKFGKKVKTVLEDSKENKNYSIQSAKDEFDPVVGIAMAYFYNQFCSKTEAKKFVEIIYKQAMDNKGMFVKG